MDASALDDLSKEKLITVLSFYIYGVVFSFLFLDSSLSKRASPFSFLSSRSVLLSSAFRELDPHSFSTSSTEETVLPVLGPFMKTWRSLRWNSLLALFGPVPVPGKRQTFP